MKTEIGLWIDWQKATIIVASDAQEEVSEILSHAATKPSRKLFRVKDQYYNRVIAQIRQATSVLIFGPDEAKAELQCRLQEREPSDRKVNVETGHDMNPRQIMSKVRSYFRSGAMTSPAPSPV